MRRPHTLPAFTPEEREKAHRLLATRVAFMMGRKLEEGDWAHVYCTAKGIPYTGWSNLNVDVTYLNTGVEHKMLRQPADVQLKNTCGMRLMHPSATRSIRITSTEMDPNSAAKDSAQINADPGAQNEEAVTLNLTAEAYELLTASFPGLSDEHMIQLLIRQLQKDLN